MSSLTIAERAKLEKLLDMAGGYVSNFSNATFALFFADVANVDIHDPKYQLGGTSKANKLREFWKQEPDHLVGRVIAALIQHAEDSSFGPMPQEKMALLQPCKAIAIRLSSGKIAMEDLKQTASVFDAKHLADQIRRIEQSVEVDPALAIGTAKELIETCCKTILAERGKPALGTPDIPVLTRDTLKELKLVPDGIPDAARGSDVIKRLLQNLGTIGNNLAELRGLYGTGHGKHGKAQGLTPRHAKLAVGCATTLATFLFDTHKNVQ